MDRDLRLAIVRRAQRQHGLITREQLLELGMTSRAVDWALGSGQLVAVFPGVYRVAGAPDSWRGRALAAVMRVDRQARRRPRPGRPDPVVAISGPAAAHLHVLPGFSRQPELLVVTSHRASCSRVPVTHRAALTAVDITEVDGIPVTDLAWTVVDVAATTGRSGDLVTHVLGTGRLRPGQLLGPAHRTIELPGRGRVVSTIREIAGAVDHVRSRSEGALADACVAAGLDAPARNRRVQVAAGHTYELDLAWLDHWLDVEVDGPHHLLAAQRRRDRQRDRHLRGDGWQVIRVPVEEVDEDVTGVVSRIRQALDIRARG